MALPGRTWSRSVRPRARSSGTSGTSRAASSSRARPIATCVCDTRISSPTRPAASAGFCGWSGWRTPSCPSSMATRRSTTPNHSVAGNPDRLRHGVITPAQRRSLAERDGATEPAAGQRAHVATAPPLRIPAPPGGRRPPGGETIFDRAPAGEGAGSRLARRVRRHLRWVRTEGFSRLVEEDELNPLTRVRVAAAKWEWRRHTREPAGSATPVYLVGLQRSGTNMLARGLDIAPEFEVHNENDRAVFDHFLLRDDDCIRRVVLASKHTITCSSSRCATRIGSTTPDSLNTPSPGRAIWAYRDVDGRARSAVSKFGRNNLLMLATSLPATPPACGNHSGCPKRRSREIAQLRLRDDDTGDRGSTLLVDSKRAVLRARTRPPRRHPPRVVPGPARDPGPPRCRRSARSSVSTYRPALIAAHRTARCRAARPLDIDPRVRALCAQLQDRLDEALRGYRARAAPRSRGMSETEAADGIRAALGSCHLPPVGSDRRRGHGRASSPA